MPLRNTRQTLALAKLEGNTGVKGLNSNAFESAKTNPVYWIPQLLHKHKRGVERAGAKAILYHWKSTESCSEAEVEEWLRRRRIGEEEKCLITDEQVSRGWEASHTLVVALGGYGLENLVMRTLGYCALVKGKLNVI